MKKLSWTFQKYVCTTEHQVNNENLIHKWENLPNNAVVNDNELSWNFRKYIRTTKPPRIIDKLPYNMVIYPIMISYRVIR